MCVKVSEDSFTERYNSAEATAVTLSARVRTLQERQVLYSVSKMLHI